MKTKTLILAFSACLLAGAAEAQAQRKNKKPAPQAVAPQTEESSLLTGGYGMSAFQQGVFDGFLRFYDRGVQEKLYLATDKPYYSAGESLWFKGFLVNAITLSPQTASKFIYVELINGRDSLLQRVKVRADESGFHNALKLPPDIPAGQYVLRAYTQWMENEDPAFFFSRTVRIANPIDDAVTGSVSYDLNPDGTVQATILLTNNYNEPMSRQRFVYTTRFDDRLRSYNARTDELGISRFTFTPPPDSVQGTIRVVVNDELRQMNRIFVLPGFDTGFDVQFFPEGGHLLSGELQQIAFKAIGTNGLGIDVTGKLFESDGTPVGEIKSQHKGMGAFNLLALPGKKYYAEIASPLGVIRRFDLPEASASGCRIRMIRHGQKLLYQVIATPDVDLSKLGIVVHSKGHVLIADELQEGKLVKSVNLDQLPDGILAITVVDKQTGEPYSERLWFVHRAGGAKVTLKSDKTDYYAREKVTLSLKATDSAGNPVAGSFALSVTDRNAVRRDSTADNIYSNLLLTSDLKGYIEEPGYYFIDDDVIRQSHLDLLMLTQGWKRFSLKGLMQKELEPYKYRAETSQFISGSVTGFFGNAVRDPQIMFMSPMTGYFDRFQLDGTNRFTFVDLEFPDSTVFILQATNRAGRGLRSITLNVDPEKFPLTHAFIPRVSVDKIAPSLPDAFLDQSRERYYYEGGVRMIDLRAVTVTAQRREVPSHPLAYGLTPTRSVSASVIEAMSGQSILQILGTMAGVRVTGETISVRGSADPPKIYVDNFEIEPSELDMVSTFDVKSIDLIAGPEANIFGLGASGGVILIGLKDGTEFSPRVPLPSLVRVQHLGFKKPEQFYQPKYEVESVRNDTKPDLRTTVCWDPTIRTDSTGVVQATFYTADNPSVYDVVLEGVTDRGEVCRTVAAIRRQR